MAKAKPIGRENPCKYCADGVKLFAGDHWIVHGLGKIKIVKCKRAVNQ